MRKNFTFVLMSLFLFAGVINAQNYRKWDFTSWSAQTIADLQEEAAVGTTGGNWSDVEKANGDNPTSGACFWSYANNVSAEGYLMANGHVVAETDGLVWNTSYTSARSLAIAVNYPSTSLGTYAGPQYLWLGSSAKTCFTIPKVRIGQKITIVAESHKPAEGRGVGLYVGTAGEEANLIGEQFKPLTLETKVWEEGWTLPAGTTGNADGETVDIIVYNTNGCHLYSIEIGEASEKSKIGYIYNGDYNADMAFGILGGIANYEVEPVEATATLSRDVLAAYDAIVISASVSNAEAIASLKDIRPFVPTLNLNPAMYTAWEMGTLSDSGLGFADVKNTNHALFRDLEIVDEEGFKGLPLASGSYQAVTLAGQFANDVVLATTFDQEATAIHEHNMNHNGYIYIPAIDGANPALVANAIKLLANSKSKIGAAPKPTIAFDYKNQNTNVVLKSSVPFPVIYYTTDGSEPTEASTLYTEPFNIAQAGVTVKAIVKGEGYLLSEVAEATVDLKDQSAAPTISVTNGPGASTITLACTSPDVEIYYNFTNSTDSTKSSKYTAPIVLMTDQTITAFAASETLVQSESATQSVTIQNPVVFTETLAHMDANKAEYYEAPIEAGDCPVNDSKVAYFFSWGKTKGQYPYYDTNADPIGTTVDPETGDEINVYPMSPEEKCDLQNGWGVRSRGQIVCTEITIKPGTDLGNTATYNPASVEEFEFSEQYPCTDIYLNISEWDTSNAPRSGMIYTTKKVQGPFAILSYISNGNSGTGPRVVFETGTDIEGDAVETEWKQIGDTCVLNQGQRLYKKFVRIYHGTDEVYVRTRIADGGSKAGFYDIYILGVDPASITGISEVNNDGCANATTKGEAIYNLNGVRQQGLQHGINIVRQADGTVKKVLVK